MHHLRKISWRRKWQSTPVFLPGKYHGRRSLIGYRPWGHKESDTIEQLHFHFLKIFKMTVRNGWEGWMKQEWPLAAGR